MNNHNKIIAIFGIVLICSVMFIVSGLHTEKIVETERHYISMKWIEKQMLDTDYYFEFDNTTSFLIDSDFTNPSYIYHKYEKGDMIQLEYTSTLVSLKWWK